MRIYFIDFIDNQIKMIKNKRESNKRKKKEKKNLELQVKRKVF